MGLNPDKTTDEVGRPLRPVLFNTAKDGSGTWYFALVDADGHLQVDSMSALPAGTNVIGKVGHDVTGIGDGRKTVATAGTREALADSTTAKLVIITAETDNTGYVVVGGLTVVAALATRRGTPLNAGDSITLEVDDLADVYLDVTVSGDGCTYLYLT